MVATLAIPTPSEAPEILHDPPIQLGFAADPSASEDADKGEDEIPSTIGGTPTWLARGAALAQEHVACPVCGNAMALLLQLYTPDEASDSDAYDRMVYVFVCPDGRCHAQESPEPCFAVFRQQLPLDAAPQSQAPTLCGKCGLVAHDQTSRCTPPFLPAVRIDSEDEPGAETGHANMMRELKRTLEAMKLTRVSDSREIKLVQRSAAEIEEEYEKSHVDVDRAFLQFQKRVIRAPAQVLRYARVGASDASEPLWVRAAPPPDAGTCALCASRRTFEFQIMPQMLNHLAIDHRAPFALDWGIVAVYTCPENCAVPLSASLREFCAVQHASDAGMGTHFERLASGGTFAASKRDMAGSSGDDD